jgi:hypothetical protein
LNVNLVRSYDHFLGESWCLEDGGNIIGMFFGPEGKTRALRRLETMKHRPEPLRRTLEAREHLLALVCARDRRKRAGEAVRKRQQRHRREAKR